MSTSEDRWFEIWFSEGTDLRPHWLYAVTPDMTEPGNVLVYDPQEDYRVVYQGQDYENTCTKLLEDEFHLVEGRMFPDDGWRLPNS